MALNFLNDGYFAGKVGIGTPLPSTRLHIDQSSNDRAGGLYIERNASNYGLSMFVNSGGYGIIGSNGTYTTDILTLDLNLGNVGIGAASPASKLHIDSNSNSTYPIGFRNGELRIANDNSSNVANQTSSIVLSATGWAGSSTGVAQLSVIQDGSNISNGTFTIKVRDNGTHSEAFRIKYNGNVGIGEISPNAKLHVNAGTENTVALFESTDARSRIVLKDNSGEGQLSAIGDNITFATSSSATERMRITSAGGISFGSTGTAYGTSGQVLTSAGNASPTWTTPTTGTVTGGGSNTYLAKWTTATNINSSAMFQAASGNFSIGITTPNAKLSVVNDISIGTSATDVLRLSNISGVGGIYGFGSRNLAFGSITNGEVMRVDNINERVGIGTTSPDAKLDVIGQGIFQGSTTSSYKGANVGTLNINNNSADGTVDFTQGLVFTDNVTNQGSWTHAGIVSVGSTGYNGSLVFGTDGDGVRNTSGITEKMRITSGGNVGIGTTSPASEANLSLGANSTSEGGHLVLFKGTSQTQATHLDNYANTFRIMNGADASSGAVQFSLNHTTAAATFAGDITLGANHIGRDDDNYIGFESDDLIKFRVAGATQVKISDGVFTAQTDSDVDLGSSGVRFKELWVDSINGGSVVPGSYLPLAGGTMTGVAGVVFPDSFKLNLGTNSNLQIYHGGTNSHIDQNGSGDLYIKNSVVDGDIFFQGDDGTGTGVTNYFTINGGGGETRFQKFTRHNDGVKAQFGNGDDLQIYHDGSNSYIKDAGTGILAIQGNIIALENTSGVNYFVGVDGAQAELYYNGDKKLSTEIISVGTATTTGGTLIDGWITTTQANAVNNTTIATTAYVNNKIALIPAGLVFQGTWDARTQAEGGAAGNKGNPALTSGVGTTGNFYIVSNAGSVNLDGITDWKVGDWAVFIEQGASDQWEKIDNSSVLDGFGTGQSVTKWDGSGTSNTLTNGPITFSTSNNNSTFTGSIYANTIYSSTNSSYYIDVVATGLGLNMAGSATFAGDVTVGTGVIKTSIGGDIAITQGAIGLRINDSASAISPTTASANNDNTVDLGVSNIRWKDLYLGGDINLAAGKKLQYSANSFMTPENNVSGAEISTAGTFIVKTGTTPTLGLTLDASQNAIFTGDVGIGTSSFNHFTNTKELLIEGDVTNTNSVLQVISYDNLSSLAIYAGAYSTDDPAIIYQNDLRFGSTNGVGLGGYSEKMRITNGGNVGIGVTSPQSKLQVAYPGNVNGGSMLLGQGGSGTSKWSFLAGTHYNQASGSGNGAGSAGVALIGSFANSTTNVVYIGGGPYEINAATQIKFYTNSTNLSTQGGTHVMNIANNGSIRFNTYDGTNKTGTPTYMLGTDASGNVVKVLGGDIPGGGGTVTGTGVATRVAFWNTTSSLGSNADLYWDNTNDRLLVGTTTFPDTAKLAVAGMITVTSGTYNFLQLKLDSSNSIVEANGTYQNLVLGTIGASGSTIFKTANTTKMTILPGGNVGIGTTSPTTHLEVVASQSNSSIRAGGLEMQSYAVNNSWYAENLYYDGGWKLRSNGYATQMYMRDSEIRFYRFATGNAGDYVTPVETMRLGADGKVGIDVTNPSAKLQVTSAGGNGSAGYTGYGILTTAGGNNQATIGAMHDGDGYASLNLGSNVSSSNVFWHISKRTAVSTDFGGNNGLDYFYYNGSSFTNAFGFSTAGNFKAAGSIQMANDTATPSATKVGTMRYRTGTEYVEVTGTELVTNGDFATDTNWTKGTGWTISGGFGVGNLTTNNYGGLSQSPTLSAGVVYRYQFTISSYTSGAVRFAIGATDNGTSISGNGFYSGYITYTAPHSSGSTLAIFAWGNFVGSVDNVSVVEVTAEDASYADMCMQTGASTYEWVNIVRNTY